VRSIGFLTRILVRPHPAVKGRYELVCGQLRLLAARRLGLCEIPADVAEMDDAEVVRATLDENLQRVDLDPIEEARGLRLMMDELGISERQVAEAIGKSRPYVANRLRLLKLDPYLEACVLSKTLAQWAALLIDVIPAGFEKYLVADLAIDWSLSFEEIRGVGRTLSDGGDLIRFVRDVPVGKIRRPPTMFEGEPCIEEVSMRLGFLIGDLSVWPNGVVRSGYLKAASAVSSGRDVISAEVVYDTSWFARDTASRVVLGDGFKGCGRGLFPGRSVEQRRCSRRLCGLLKGREELYPVLVLEGPGRVGESPPQVGGLPGDI
jgi:ParB/RepB/Spo0J family partition protein